MKKLALYSLIILLVTACTTSPLGRKQLSLVSDEKLAEMGSTSFEKIKSETPLSQNQRLNSYVNCVAAQVLIPLGETGRGWELAVFDQDQVNAFALPGKKIGVYIGLLKVTENQDQLAAVIGHEIAHVLSNHANERVSTNLATSIPLNIGSMIYGGTVVGQTAMAALGLGAQVGILLPYGRKQETEADLYGLDLMARAGFDPRESINLWKNMGKAGGPKPPEFISTHPSDETRIEGLLDRMSHALKLYNDAQAAGRRPECT